MFKLFKILEEIESPYNGKLQVIKTLEGVRILAGGLSQSGWLVKKIWETGLKRIKKDLKKVDRVLILGLGGGSAAQLVSKHWPDAQITGIDIDPFIVGLGKKYLGLSEIKNLEFVETDANVWVKKTAKNNKINFDLILIDLYRGAEIPKIFESDDFIKDVKKITSHNGAVAFNHLYSYIEKEDADRLGSKLLKVFSNIKRIYPEANVIYVCYK